MDTKAKSVEEYMVRRPSRLHKRNWTEEGEKVVVTSPFGKTYWLNGSAAFVWKMCDGRHSIKDIIDVMIKRYTGVDRNTAINDVIEFIQSLETLGLVELQ